MAKVETSKKGTRYSAAACLKIQGTHDSVRKLINAHLFPPYGIFGAQSWPTRGN